MEKNADYNILQSVLFDNRRGFALGQHENPNAPQPFVTWQFTQDGQQRDYYWGHYFGEEQAALEDYAGRVDSYKQQYKVQELPQPQQKTYKYFSTQRPVDVGTYPKGEGNQPLEINNYHQRMFVEHDTILAWGELVYVRPLTSGELYDYELEPSRYNPDVWEHLARQAQIVGKWEEENKLPERERMTWWHPDFDAYVVKEHVHRERIDRCVSRIEMFRAAGEHKRKKPPIAKQMKEAKKLARANRGNAVKPHHPEHEER